MLCFVVDDQDLFACHVVTSLGPGLRLPRAAPAAALGSSNANVVPRPGALVDRRACRPCRSTIRAAIARPSPVPPRFVVKNGSRDPRQVLRRNPGTRVREPPPPRASSRRAPVRTATRPGPSRASIAFCSQVQITPVATARGRAAPTASSPRPRASSAIVRPAGRMRAATQVHRVGHQRHARRRSRCANRARARSRAAR